MDSKTIQIQIPNPHSPEQASFVRSVKLRQIIRAGRRFGKTVGAAIKALERFTGTCSACGGLGCPHCNNNGKIRPGRVLYAAPVTEQVSKFWYEITDALYNATEAGYLKKNETEHYIDYPDTEIRLQARTAWNADTLRGGFWDLLVLEEYQLMNEDAWEVVGEPMLLDTNGTAVFIYTPPSLRSIGVSKARDPRHAAKLYKKALSDTTGDWDTFHFTSHQNPTISKEALARITRDMTKDAYFREILAEDDDIQLSWLVYKSFNDTIRKIPRTFDIPLTWPVYSGHDFGSANPAGLFFAQVKLPLPQGAPPEMRYGDMVAFREYLPGAGLSTPQHVDTFKSITRGYTVVDSRGGSHQEDGSRSDFRAHGWNISEPTINSVKQQLDRVIGLYELNKVWIFDDLYNWLEEMMNCLWKIDNYGKPTNVIDNESGYHLCACARYILSGLTPETIIRPKTDRIMSYL